MSKRKAEPAVTHPTEEVAIADLRSHPRNYRRHPAAQIRHLAASLRQFGQFRNVVVARDGTILAGHGVVEAMRKLGWERAAVVRLDLDPLGAEALKLVALDNEVPRLGESDDRALAELIREVSASADAGGLVGTGFDDDAAERLLRQATGDFPPGTGGEQGRLDELAPITCPKCGAEVPRR